MKRSIFVVAALCAALVSLQAVAQNRAEWRFSKNREKKAVSSYLETGYYNAAVGIKDATLSFNHKGKVVKCDINAKGFPTARSVAGDYWLFEVPVGKVEPGTVVDLFLPFTGNEGERNAFVLEYLNGKRWVEATPTLSTTSHKHMTRLWHSVRLDKGAKGGKVALRLRQTDQGEVQSAVAAPSAQGQLPQVILYDAAVPRDTLKILFIGNSYTYYHTYPVIFKEMAWKEGHYADCSIFVSGGYTMQQHLKNKHCMEVVDRGGYDYAMLQDQSILPTLNGTADDAGMVENMGKMVDRVRKTSPKSKALIEITWGRKFGNNNFGKYEPYLAKYPHFYSSYDAMQNRLIEVLTAEAEQLKVDLNPLGYAWQIVMHEREDINLYHKDNHHQSYAGAYLSAAVAYLTIYKEPFGDNSANGKLKPETAAYLRKVAERVVLHGEKWGK